MELTRPLMSVWIFMLEVFVWERRRSAFFDIRVCHPNGDSYRDLTPKQIYKKHENEKKRQYAERVMEIEQGTFTPPVCTTTGGMAKVQCIFRHRTLCDTMLERLEIQKKTARLC